MKFNSKLLLPLIVPLLIACADSGRRASQETGKNIVSHAQNLSIVDNDGYSLVDIRDPWDTTHMLASYILIDRTQKLPEGVDTTGHTVIRVPIERSVIFSNVYVALVRELGMIDNVTGVCDTEYITDSIAAGLVRSGRIANCGQSMSPNVERIMTLRPDGIILSPMGPADKHGKLGVMGIPLIEAADYLEETPLGRAEWMRFYGRLYGQGAKADSLFATVQRDYDNIRKLASGARNKPTVLFDGIYSNVWNVPTSRSVTGNFIKDAGGTNPFESYEDIATATLSPEKVMYQAGNADVWMVRYFRPSTMTLAEWGKENEIYPRFKAFRNGQVYGSNTAVSGVFDDAAFHPQWILADIAVILHPELAGRIPSKHYYMRLASE